MIAEKFYMQESQGNESNTANILVIMEGNWYKIMTEMREKQRNNREVLSSSAFEHEEQWVEYPPFRQVSSKMKHSTGGGDEVTEAYLRHMYP